MRHDTDDTDKVIRYIEIDVEMQNLADTFDDIESGNLINGIPEDDYYREDDEPIN